MTHECNVHFKATKAGRKRLNTGITPAIPMSDRIPRISRLMALAIHFDRLIRNGAIRDYADLARLGGITRARTTQIMNLLNLAPKIQERLLFLSGSTRGRDRFSERNLRAMIAKVNWAEQAKALKSS